jgi:hypothetical protein
MTLDPVVISNFFLYATAFGAAFLAALWLSLIIWTYRDIRTRTRDPLLRSLAILVSVMLFIPGVLVYLIIRPRQTLEEEYQQALEEEALLQTIEDKPICPGCGRKTVVNWQVCPNCHTKLRKTCHECGKVMELAWNLCPFCSTPVPGVRLDSDIITDDSIPFKPESSIDVN